MFDFRGASYEVRHQVGRLIHHPSIIIWAGNNENEAALRQNWYNTSDDFSTYQKDYVTLYIDTIKTEMFKHVPEDAVIFITSSPTNGLLSEEQEYVAENPADPRYGDGTL